MLNFLKIDSVYDKLYSEVFNLYTQTFPKKERRTWAAMEAILNSDKRYNLFALLHENNFAGFIAYWKFEHFFFIEHFVITPKLRGHKLGSEAIKYLIDQADLPLVLEVEPPKTIIAGRRIHFYERLGFYVIPGFYMQPPYDNSSFLIPMLIMSNDYHYVNRHFNFVKETLYSEVYNYS